MPVTMFSYLPDLTRTLDRVRFALGDIDPATATFDDRELTATLTTWSGRVSAAVAAIAESMAARSASLATSETVGDISRAWADRGKAWAAIAVRYRQLDAEELAGLSPDTGGVAALFVEVEPLFYLGMYDRP